MNTAPGTQQANRPRLLVNLGAGRKGHTWLPDCFKEWREFRVDVDPSVQPDLLADLTDLSAIETGSTDAVWSSHCLEHLFAHQVGTAISEAFRILRDDGFLCVIVPDLQAIAEFLLNDKLHEIVYELPAGPVIAHDIIYGYGPHLSQGVFKMAHNCGFTPALLLRRLQEAAPFAEIVMRRRPGQELAAVARKTPPANDAERDALMSALQL